MDFNLKSETVITYKLTFNESTYGIFNSLKEAKDYFINHLVISLEFKFPVIVRDQLKLLEDKNISEEQRNNMQRWEKDVVRLQAYADLVIMSKFWDPNDVSTYIIRGTPSSILYFMKYYSNEVDEEGRGFKPGTEGKYFEKEIKQITNEIEQAFKQMGFFN